MQEAHTVSDSTWYKPWTWWKTHTEYTTHTEHYSYCVASDAIDNLRKYAMEATNQVEQVFTEAIQVKGNQAEAAGGCHKKFRHGQRKNTILR